MQSIFLHRMLKKNYAQTSPLNVAQALISTGAVIPCQMQSCEVEYKLR